MSRSQSPSLWLLNNLHMETKNFFTVLSINSSKKDKALPELCHLLRVFGEQLAGKRTLSLTKKPGLSIQLILLRGQSVYL